MSRTALIVIDMLNTYEHPDGDRLARSVEQALPAMERVIDRALGEGVLTSTSPTTTAPGGPTAATWSWEDVGRLVLIGQVTEQCVMHSALDAYIGTCRWPFRATPWPTSTSTSRRRRSSW
jgi:nicotinamidase-related amidase